MEREQGVEPLIREDRWAVYCGDCGFESYRGFDERTAGLVAQGHVAVTGHTPDLYEIDFNKPLGWVSQSRPSQAQIDAMIDMLA